MVATSTITGALRTGSNSKSSNIGTPVCTLGAQFDPTSTPQIELFTIPKDSIVLEVVSLGGATGGTNPTVDIGTSGDDDGFANELRADIVAYGGNGALTGVAATKDEKVFGKVGAAAATGGQVTIVLKYIMIVEQGF